MRFKVVMLGLFLILFIVGCTAQGVGNNNDGHIDINTNNVNNNKGNSSDGISDDFDDNMNDDGEDSDDQGDQKESEESKTKDQEKTFEDEKDRIIKGLETTINNAFEKATDPYLIGWTFSVRTSGLTKEQVASFDLASAFESMIVAREFTYNVGIPYKVATTDNGVYCVVGKTNDFPDPFAQSTTVEASNTSATHSHKDLEDEAYSSESIHIQFASITTTSEIVTFKETIEIEGWETVNGTMNFVRIGPGVSASQLDIDVDGTILDGDIEAEIPQGDYQLTFKKEEVGFEIAIASDYIFLVDEHGSISVEGLKTVEGTIYVGEDESNRRPYEGAEVRLVPLITDAGIDEDFTDVTDKNGNYEIDDVPLGIYTILVDGVEQGRLEVNVPGDGEKEVPDIYKPGNVFDVKIVTTGHASTVTLTFEDVVIDIGSQTPVGYFDGAYFIMEDIEVYPDSKVINSKVYDDVIAQYDEIYFSVIMTDESASGYLKPNAYYLDWMFSVNWLDNEYRITVDMEFNGMNLPVTDGDPYNGLVDTEAFEALLFKGEPFSHHSYVQYITDTWIYITPSE